MDFLIRIARSGVIAPEPAVWWMKIVVRRQKVNGSPVGRPLPEHPYPTPGASFLFEIAQSPSGSFAPGCSTAGWAGKMAPCSNRDRFWRKPLACSRISGFWRWHTNGSLQRIWEPLSEADYSRENNRGSHEVNAVETGDAGQSTMAVVLAGGRGTRMQSDLPKVLFPVHGRPMIHWVLDALDRAGVEEKIVVVGYRAELVQEELRDRAGVRFALQEQQLGTGHAVQMAIPYLNKHAGTVLVAAGDSPMVQSSSLLRLLERFSSSGAACLLGTLIKENPKGLGRILRDAEGRFSGIVEEKDATESQKAIHEVNMSTYLFRVKPLLEALAALGNHNAQGEYYLTDCPSLMMDRGYAVEARAELDACEALSINTLDELTLVEVAMKEMGYPCAS